MFATGFRGTPEKGLFDPKGVLAPRLRTAGPVESQW